MIIGKDFAWGHVPKAAGDATTALFGLFPDLILFADPITSGEKHASFIERESQLRGKELVLNIRRLPTWMLSWAQEQSHNHHGKSPTKRFVGEVASSSIADAILLGFTDSGRFHVGRWLRTESLVDDFLELVSSFTPVADELRDKIRATKETHERDYNKDLSYWFSERQLRKMYEANPAWAELEARIYPDAIPVSEGELKRRRWSEGTEEGLPPERLRSTVCNPDVFERSGRRQLRYFKELAGLERGDRVLDVGCGVGRMAMPLRRYLKEGGSYEGFDVMRESIEWCAEHLESSGPPFAFRAVDVYNRKYNPTGLIDGRAYVFPYEDGECDFVVATSVFRNMLPDDVSRYIVECGRVLKPGGRMVMSMWLLDGEALDAVSFGTSKLELRETEGGWVVNPELPEEGVAHDERHVLGACEKAGLVLRQPVHRGGWRGKPPGPVNVGEDLLVLDRSD